jgi:hypothetical protein
MERLLSSISRPTIGSVRCIPQLILSTRAIQKAAPQLFNDAPPSNYTDAMYEQWSKDPQSVHKV